LFVSVKIENHLSNFKKRYDDNVRERQTLENRKELMRTRMSRAYELTSALDTEKVYNLVLKYYNTFLLLKDK
jgi:hypothetical protein